MGFWSIVTVKDLTYFFWSHLWLKYLSLPSWSEILPVSYNSLPCISGSAFDHCGLFQWIVCSICFDDIFFKYFSIGAWVRYIFHRAFFFFFSSSQNFLCSFRIDFRIIMPSPAPLDCTVGAGNSWPLLGFFKTISTNISEAVFGGDELSFWYRLFRKKPLTAIEAAPRLWPS